MTSGFPPGKPLTSFTLRPYRVAIPSRKRIWPPVVWPAQRVSMFRGMFRWWARENTERRSQSSWRICPCPVYWGGFARMGVKMPAGDAR